jgi:hypothetical protein
VVGSKILKHAINSSYSETRNSQYATTGKRRLPRLSNLGRYVSNK